MNSICIKLFHPEGVYAFPRWGIGRIINKKQSPVEAGSNKYSENFSHTIVLMKKNYFLQCYYAKGLNQVKS
jgi:hypothetical protein